MNAGTPTSTASILFCDVVESTERRSKLGEVAADRLFRAVEKALRDAIAESGGRTIKGGGDGVMATFGAASDAVDAAVALQKLVHHIEPDLRLRVGLSSGDVTWEDGDCFGLPVIVAARLEGACEPGSVLVSAIVRYLAGDRARVRYESVGQLDLKGIPDPVDAFRVLPIPSAAVEHEIRFPAVLPPPGSMPFVGRRAERVKVLNIWEAVREGGRATVLIGGEAGAGKTRLISEVAREVHQRGAIVLAGSCDSELALPYQPWARALGELIEQLPADVIASLEGELSALHSIVPAVERLGVTISGDRREPEEERHQLFLAVVGVLRAVTRLAPVCLILDDVHWAGEQTLALLRFVTRSDAVDGLMLGVTFRDTGDEVSAPLTSVLAEFRRDARATRLKLSGIDVEAVAELLGAVGVAEGLTETATVLRERTGGNPFLLGEVAREISRGADLAAVPESVRDVVAQRFTRISGNAASVARLIAVGGTVSLPILRAAADLDLAELAPALDELVQSGLVVELPHATPAYQFGHALIRDAVQASLPVVARAELHHSLALGIEHAHESDRRLVLVPLVRHFVAAAPLAGWEKAFYYGRRGAAQARRTAAYEEGLRLLELCRGVVPAGSRELTELLLDGTDLLQRCGRHPEAIAWAEEADVAAGRAGATELQVAAAVEHERAAQLGNLPSGRAAERLVALRSFAESSDPHLGIRVSASLGRAYALMGRPEGILLARQAVVDARASEDDATLAHALETALNADSNVAPEVLLQMTAELAVANEATGNVFRSFWGTANKVFAYIGMARLGKAASVNKELIEQATAYQLASFEYEGAVFASVIALAEGRLDEAEAMAERGSTAADERFAGVNADGSYGLQMFLIRREQDRLGEVRPLFELLARSSTDGVWHAGALAAYVELGMWENASALFEQLTEPGLAAIPRDVMWPTVLSFLIEAAIALDRRDLAVELRDELIPFAGRILQSGFTSAVGPADAFRAMVEEWLGNALAADEALGAARELVGPSGSPVWTAQVELAAAWIAVRRGDVAALDQRLAAATDLAERYGLGRVTRRVGLLSGAQQASASETSDRALPDDLSEREMEVLQCLAKGLTNKAIGDQLFISKNTVANHVRNILQKTGLTNRTEAAAYALRLGLVELD